MRILLVVDIGWRAGGAERSVSALRDELNSRGHETCILATDLNAPGHVMFADVLVPAITGSPLRRLCHYFFYRTAYAAMRRTIHELRPDIIHFHTVGELSPAVLFGARGVPHIITVHGPEDFTLRLLRWQLPAHDFRGRTYRWRDLKAVGALRYAYLRWAQRPVYLLALRRCAGYVGPSNFMADVLHADAAGGQIAKVCNGIPLPDPGPTAVGTSLLYVGRLEAVKGTTVLLRAFKLLHEQHCDTRLEILGDGSERSRLEALAVELGVSEQVRFRGWADEEAVHEALADCLALVIPSIWPENFPTVALEALAVGRAIVATRVGGMQEIVGDELTGLLVQPGDVGALAAAMCKMVADPDSAALMGQLARTLAEQFSLDRFTSNLLDLYAEVTAS